MKSPIRNWSLGRRLTLGILVLTAIAFMATGVLTQSLLRGYLTSEVDSQITAIAEGTLPRILESGIAHEADDIHGNDDHRNPVKRSPLARIPTSTSLTLIDPNGVVVAGLGGDFQGSSIKGYLTALSKEEVSQHGNKHLPCMFRGQTFAS